MRRGRSWMPLSKLGLLILIFLVALLSLISFHVATKLREDKNLPKTYAEPLPLQNAAPDDKLCDCSGQLRRHGGYGEGAQRRRPSADLQFAL